MKNKFGLVLAGIALLAVTMVATAADVVGVNPNGSVAVVNSQTPLGFPNYTNTVAAWTNGNFYSTNGIWPPAITNLGAAANVTITWTTNVTTIIPQNTLVGNHITFQLTAAQVGTASGNLTYILGRSVPGGNPTNNVGSGLPNIEWFLTGSLALSTTSGTQATVTTNLSDVNGTVGAATQYYLQALGVTNNMIITNYQAYINSR